MSLLKKAVTNKRWDLAAYTLVLASARALQRGGAHERKKDQPGKTGRRKKS